jgi:hypothetical protein
MAARRELRDMEISAQVVSFLVTFLTRTRHAYSPRVLATRRVLAESPRVLTTRTRPAHSPRVLITRIRHVHSQFLAQIVM